MPLINELKAELRGVKDDVSHLTESVNSMREIASNFEEHKCGGTGGWRRVGYLNMTDRNTTCPSGWQLTGHPNRTCGRASSGSLTCDSVTFPVTSGNYTRVCGRIIGYQYNPTDAFEAYDNDDVTTIDEAYVSGVSLTHGSPRQHIWTFAAGVSKTSPARNDACPCDATRDINVPPFVGGDYFCESGATSVSSFGFHGDDPLWDGEGCSARSTCCSFNDPPYFTKQLSSPTSDDIEVRICNKGSNEDIPIEFIELYVQYPNTNTEQLVQLHEKMEALDSKLMSMNASVANAVDNTAVVMDDTNCIKEDLTILRGKVNSLSDTMDEHETLVATEVVKLDAQLQQNFLLQQKDSFGYNSPPVYTCGDTGGWRRVAYLDMRDPNTTCPSGWQLAGHSKRTCGRVSSGSLTCDSVFFPVRGGGDYTRVCGRIIGYQYSYTDAFEAYNGGDAMTIDDAYVSGVSLTHGSPRQHIWTFAAGISEASPNRNDICPCDTNNFIAVPPFVDRYYFCESGANLGSRSGFLGDDPLWDGEGCSTSSTCCSFNDPPYFNKQLLSSTSDDIEARICQLDDGEDTPIEIIELYVQ